MGEIGQGGGGVLGNMLGGGESGGGGGAAGAGGPGGIGRSIFNQTGISESLPSVRGLIPGGFLAANTQMQDRSVKFNPLVHNFYYNNQKSDFYDKAMWEKALLEQQQQFYNQDNQEKVSWSPGTQQNGVLNKSSHL